MNGRGPAKAGPQSDATAKQHADATVAQLPGSTGQAARDRSPLRQVLDETGGSLKDLTVLALQNDPFRIDTPARHRDGEWLAVTARELGLGTRPIHLRGLHHMVISRPKPDGTPYTNTDPDWLWLSGDAGKAARWLGYLPFEQIVDQRNAAPEVRTPVRKDPFPYIWSRLDVDLPPADDIVPEVGVGGFEGEQPYRLVLFGEKSSVADVLGPIAQDYDADLYLPTGEISDTLMYRMAKDAAEDGRPLRVFTFSDCDPAGWQMPISIARKLQAFRALGTLKVPAQDLYGNAITRAVELGGLEFEVRRVALTPDMVREHDLPSTPLKDTERRADKWTAEMRVQQTEIDALASLQPALLRRVAWDAIRPFYDSSLASRVLAAKEDWCERAQAVVDANLDVEQLQRIRVDAEEQLRTMREEIDRLNQSMRLSAADFDLPPVEIPEPEVDDHNLPEPLVSSDWPFADQCRRLKESKGYAAGSGGGPCPDRPTRCPTAGSPATSSGPGSASPGLADTPVRCSAPPRSSPR